MFEQELKLFEENRKHLCENELGKFALVFQKEITSWDTWKDALNAGYLLYGIDKQFMIKQILEVDKVHFINVARQS